jgi:hypothetical protein
MDAEATALLKTAGTTVAGLMATAAWQQTHDGLVRLWQRFRPEHAEAVGRELAVRRAIVVAAPPPEAGAVAGAGLGPGFDLGALWARELPKMLADPRAAHEFAALLLECGRSAAAPSGDAETAPREPWVVAKTKGHGRAYAAGRDMKIAERPGVES